MIRKQIYLTEQQDASIRRLVAATGRTQSELLRHAVEEFIEQQTARTDRRQSREERSEADSRILREMQEVRRGADRDPFVDPHAAVPYLTARQSRLLKSLSTQTGREQEELFREALERYLSEQKPKGDWKEALRKACGMWANYPEVEDIIRESRRQTEERMQERMKPYDRPAR